MITPLMMGLVLFAASPVQVKTYSGLGPHVRKVKTSSPAAQRYFNQGLNFLYAFNHDEAIRSFAAAAKADPKCAMAWWGIATANGPHINNPAVDEAHAKAAWDALRMARQTVDPNQRVEQRLVAAALKRFANPQPASRVGLDAAYAKAMRDVYRRYPGDADVGALFAEAMMDLRPWDLWTKDLKPQPGTEEIVRTLRSVLQTNPNHPLGLHLTIHAVEASSDPASGVEAANRLRFLQPGLGHMVHMPSHIDVRTGAWQQAVEANARAIIADNAYAAKQPQINFYRLYMAHNYHMLAFAAMMSGQSKLAISHIDTLIAQVPEEAKTAMAPILDGFFASPAEVRVRFGKWDEVLELPDLPEQFPIARTLLHAARGVAHAAKGDAAFARAEQSLYAKAKGAIPPTATFGNNTGRDVAGVAGYLLEGEILAAEGRLNEAVAALRKGVLAEDQLRYDEPPDWIQPVRHTLGALLIRMRRFDEAVEVYKADLAKLPNNGWSLYGISRALEGKGKLREASEFRSRFARFWAKADVKISSSCLCLPGR